MGMPMPQKMSVRDKINAAKAATQAKLQAVRDARNAVKPVGKPSVSPMPMSDQTQMPDQMPTMVSELSANEIKKQASTPRVTGGGFNTPTGKFDPSTAPALPDGAVYKKGGKVSASRRADGIAQRGKTRGKYI